MVLPGRKHLLSRRVSILPPQRLDRSASLIESDQFRRRELRQCGASRDLASVFLARAARLFPKIEIGQQCSKHVAGSRVSFALATPMQRFLRVIQAHTEVIRTQSEVQVGTVHFQNSGCKHVTVMGVGCACVGSYGCPCVAQLKAWRPHFRREQYANTERPTVA